MTSTTAISVISITFFASLLRSTFGFGEALFSVPLLILFLPIGVAVPLAVLLSVVIALIVIVQDHEHIHITSAKALILFALPGIPIGLLILVYGNQVWVKVGLGIFLILHSLYSLVGKNSLTLREDNNFWLFICGFASGILGGAYGLNGPPLVLYGNMRRWSAKHFRATLQAYFLPASLMAVGGYLIKGLLNATVVHYFLISLPTVIPAIFLGRYLNHKIRDNSFFRYVYMFLMAIGVFLILDTLAR